MNSTTYYSVKKRADGNCELCGKFHPRLQVHHLIARSKTPKGHIRELTEVPELLVAICPRCHDEAESYPVRVNAELFQMLYRQYGYKQVESAFRAVSSGVRVGYDLPAPNA